MHSPCQHIFASEASTGELAALRHRNQIACCSMCENILLEFNLNILIIIPYSPHIFMYTFFNFNVNDA
jgi:hypothetical protein